MRARRTRDPKRPRLPPECRRDVADAPHSLGLDARSAPAWLGLARVLDMSGRDEEAGEARRRAAELEARK